MIYRFHFWPDAPLELRAQLDPESALSLDWLAEVPAELRDRAEGDYGWLNVRRKDLEDGRLLIAGSEPGGLRRG